jgi:hypothetical protein
VPYVIENVPIYKLAKDPKSKKLVQVKQAAPVKIANHLLARTDLWRYPHLVGVIEAPTLRGDGSLLTESGYDHASGLLLDLNGCEFPPVKENPTHEDVIAAMGLLRKPFADFPFEAHEDRAVLLSAILTSLVRRVLPAAPMHGFSAPTMGTGKTLLCDCVSMIAVGRLVTAMSQGANEEEDEKRLFSVLLTNDPIIMIDNVQRPIEGDALCTILTQDTWQCRILGESRKVAVPTNSIFLASGNNLIFRGDMTTRALLCRLDAKVERPEQRRFRVDLKVEIPKIRGELVAAALTILRGYVVAGRPGLDKLTPFGRFEDWSNLVRGALVWSGEADPCLSRTYICADDPARASFDQFIHAVAGETFGDWFTAGELLSLAEKAPDGDLAKAIDVTLPKRSPQSMGLFLKSKQGQIIKGMRLEAAYSEKRHTWLYSVLRHDA